MEGRHVERASLSLVQAISYAFNSISANFVAFGLFSFYLFGFLFVFGGKF